MPFVKTASASADTGPAHEPRPPATEPIGDADSAVAPDVQRAMAAVELPQPQRAATGSEPARASQLPSGEAAPLPPQFNKTITSSPVPAAAKQDDQPDRVDDRPLPLQAVWPVESIGPAEAAWPIDDKGSMHTTQPAESSAVAPPSQRRLPAPEDEAIQRALMGVAAGQPTRSAVELVLPRRARPATAAEPPARPTAMRQSLPDAPAPSRVTDRAAPAGRPLAGEENAPAGDMIGTEIGPLPADLWRTLGETPPAASPVPPAAAQLKPVEPFPEQATSVADIEAAIRAAEAPAARLGTRPPPGARPVAAAQPTVAAQQTTAQPPTAAARLTTAQRFPAGAVANSAIETTADVRPTGMARTDAPQQAVSGLTGASRPFAPVPRPTIPAAMPEPAAAELVSREVEPPAAVEHVSPPPAVLAAMRSEAPAGLDWAGSPARAVAGMEASPFAIQRQTEDTAPPAGEPASPAAGSAEGPAGEVDVDELARRVYSEVKRRLALEWERARGRLG